MKKKTTKKTTSKAKTPVKAKKPAAKAKAPVKAKKTTVKPKAPAKAKAAPKAAKKIVKAALKKSRITFTYRAEKGCSVFLAGTFNNWSATAKEMTDKKGTGIYTAVATLAPGSYEYKFVINDIWCADPECADWVQNSHGTLNSVKHVSL